MSSASTFSSIHTRLVDYARWKHVSHDGCRSTSDIDYRSQMLSSIADGYEQGRLKS